MSLLNPQLVLQCGFENVLNWEWFFVHRTWKLARSVYVVDYTLPGDSNKIMADWAAGNLKLDIDAHHDEIAKLKSNEQKGGA